MTIKLDVSLQSVNDLPAIPGIAASAQALSRLAARKRWADMPDLITDPMIETFAVVASPEEVGPAILHRYAGLIDRATLYLPYQPGQFDDLWQPTIQAFTTQ
jgi:alkanesulfonate monooxygenase SsuD/methylene tetrahydromethanopterin reductase-like flavin-dependent oxidoreductase (luciferase family)